jgi:hypothetical protein
MTAVTRPQPVPFVQRVRIRNYRSIANCDVTLGPLTVLVGFNAAGKTNFLDALRFIADAVVRSPAQAVANRGGLDTLLHRGRSGVADSFDITLELAIRLPDSHRPSTARYTIGIGRGSAGHAPVHVTHEAGHVDRPDSTAPLPRAALAHRLAAMRFHDTAAPSTSHDPIGDLERDDPATSEQDLHRRASLVGIETPEGGLHPVRVGALYEALADAVHHTQVIVTTRSSDLLNSEHARPEHIRVVSHANGATRVGETSAADRTILERRIMTLAELHHSAVMLTPRVESPPLPLVSTQEA